MSVVSKRMKALCLFTIVSLPMSAGLSAQELQPAAATGAEDGEVMTTVLGNPPADLSGMTEGPEIEGFIAARDDYRLNVMSDAGASNVVLVSEGTEIKGTGGFLGLGRKTLADDALLNGLPVTIKTVQWRSGLVASEIKFKTDDLETAQMIRSGTSQRFSQNEEAISKNAAAAEALRGRMADIDKYNVMGTTNVYFDSGKWNLSPAAETELCAIAQEADAMENALMLVVGYTDSDGSQDYNQVLSERRAGRVVNYLQQACGWKPYRMLTPTGMSESQPVATNDTNQGKAENRRVSVNILVSKALEESDS